MLCNYRSSTKQLLARGVGFLLVLAASVYSASVPEVSQPRQGDAVQSFSWLDGPIEYSSIGNSVVSATGQGIGAYVGVCAAPKAGQPSLNTTYYIHVVVAGRGDAAGVRAAIDVVLPSTTAPAIDGSHRVHYYVDFDQLPEAQSPQTLLLSTLNPGAFQIPSADTANGATWSVPLGRIIEIQIPVVSTTVFTNGTLRANVRCIDGSNNSWLHPQHEVFVFGALPQTQATNASYRGAMSRGIDHRSLSIDIAGRLLPSRPGGAARLRVVARPTTSSVLRYGMGGHAR